ncbi:MAG: ABC transporter ATP-binding protein [Spirochaetales bacterium]|nr:ABC transporter ATP-binding protein [Spirochaetales bacterium]
MKFIWSYMKKHIWAILLVLFVKFVGTALELLLPFILEHMIDDIAPLKDVKLILIWGFIMIALALLCRFLNVGANRGSVRIARKCIYQVRQDLFTKGINLSGDQFDEIGLPSLISRMTSDSYNIQSFMQITQTIAVRAPILLFGGIFITLSMDKGLAMVLITLAPILLIAVVIISRKGIPLYDKVQSHLDTVVRIMRENITGIRVVKALSKEDYEKRRFANANETMNRAEIKASVVMSLPGPVISLAMNVGLTLVVLFGAYRVNKGVTQPGVILAFLSYFQMILMGVLILNRFFLNMSKANASANRVASVMNRPDGLVTIKDEDSKDANKDQDIDHPYVVFDDVSFSYSGNVSNTPETESPNRSSFAGGTREKTLYNISFSIPKGGSLGIIGATGSGKTTIINLLMRFYDPQSGHVYVDGKDVRRYELDDLRRHFGTVFQNDAIFADTISENLSFGRDVVIDDLEIAARDAMASEFIEDYEDRYEHEAAIHGANFSGGQKQRILIARALAAHPDILVLDDSSSALDYKTDSILRKNIRENHGHATMIVIAQRVSSIMSLDQIIMLEEGRIIGKGTHEELLKSTPKYREIFETQMGEV